MSTSSRYRECWPVEWFRKYSFNDVPSWHFTFPAFVVGMDMRGYAQYQIDKASELDEKDKFVNGKLGRPLLFFSLYLSGQSPKPGMSRFLLEQGADINATFDGKSHIESIRINECTCTGSPQLDIVWLLLDHGGSPNSRYNPQPDQPEVWYPLLHIVAHLTNIDMGPRIRFMKYLVKQKQADLDRVDFAGRTFLDALYWGNTEMPSRDWEWLLQNRDKITKLMITKHQHGPSALRTVQRAGFEQPELSGNSQRAIESINRGSTQLEKTVPLNSLDPSNVRK